MMYLVANAFFHAERRIISNSAAAYYNNFLPGHRISEAADACTQEVHLRQCPVQLASCHVAGAGPDTC